MTTEADPLIYAPFGKRLAAYGWDSLIVIGLSFLVSISSAYAQSPAVDQAIMLYVNAGLLPPGTTTGNLLQNLGINITPRDMFMSVTLSAIYNIAFVAGEWQATPGKHLCGIKVVMADGSKLNWLQATTRHLASGVSVALCYLGFLPALWTKEKTALHDMMCHTRVVIGKN